jgi:excisionase family DNA binding protein
MEKVTITAPPASTKSSAPQLLTRELVAQRLGVSIRTTDTLILSRQIASLKIGKKRLVSETALAAFIRKHEQGAR